MKQASDFAKEVCYISKSGKRQHKDPNCRFLKNTEVIKTNRRDAYLNGIKIICINCWWSINEVEVMEAEATKKATITIEGEEIQMLKALAQNPHPMYSTSEELHNFAEKLFNFLKDV